MGPIDFTETSVTSYESTMRNIAEERRLALLRFDQPTDKTTYVLINQK